MTHPNDTPQPSETLDEIRECLCQICNREYAVWFAPNELWNKVMRSSDGIEKTPFVCPSCFALEAEKQGIGPTAWYLTTEDAEHGYIIDRLKTLRTTGNGQAGQKEEA